MAQLGDLIVSGKARFLNKISGNIDSADKVNNKLTLTVSGDGVAAYDYDGSSPVSVFIGGVTPAEHTHGNIQNGGTLQTNDITIANGDKLVVTDSSDSSKVARTSISFDGSTATQCLTKKGTWETFASSNTDTKVTQTNITTAATYSIPLCKTYNTTTETDSLYKNLGLSYSLNGNQAGLCISEPGKDDASTLSAAAISNQAIQMMSRASTTATPDILAISSTDISFLTTGTWDGTNASLKTAVTAAKGTVTQTATTTDAEYELLFSGTADNTTRTEGAKKSQYATFNPSKQAFTFGTRLSGSTVGSFSVAEGQNVTASGSGSHAEGKYTTASSEGSHAEGFNTTASNVNSHTEGSYTIASGIDSHAEGFHNTASGESSHAEGDYTTASGKYSHAEGAYTIANHKSQHVFGEYNIADASTAESTSRGNYIEIVGNGTGDSTRSNARTLDWDGNEWLAGSLTIKGNSIAYQGTANTLDMIRFVSSSDTYGHEIAIGGGGATIIGGGESPTVMMAQVAANDERMYIGNDNDVYIFSNLQNGWANRQQFSFLSNGNLSVPGASIGVHNPNVALSYTNDNNGVTSPQYALYNALDANNQRFGYVQISADASGNTNMTIRSTNFKKGASSGTVDNSLVLTTSKAGAYTYAVTNPTNFRSAIGAAASSSIKTKENIKDLTEDEALKLLEIRPVSFDYKQGFDIDNKYERNYGVIAEETVDIIPSVVNIPTTEGYEFDETKGTNQELITVDYAKFVPYLIKLVQMQQQEIDELKNR